MYIKEVEDLPKEVKLARALGAIGEDNVVTVKPEDYLRTEREPTPLRDIPGIKDLITRYVEFADSIEQLVKTRQAGKGQPQPVYFSSSRDQKRVFEFVERFFDGDPNGTFQKALRFYYKNKFSSDTDREKIEHLIKLVETDLSNLPSKRKGLEPETAAGISVSTSPPLAAVKRELGKNFLGPDEWKAQGIEVGEPPPIPTSITKKLLDSPCPLHPGEKIKDTHLLVLVPKTVNGEPYTARKLDELCGTRKGSGNKLIYDCDGADWATAWKKKDWANTAQVQSEWVLIPKSDPDPKKVPADKHFRSKNIAAQQKVHEEHYGEYREVKTLELMTAVLLYDLTNKERLVPADLRCEEPNASGGRVCLGYFAADGLKVNDGSDGLVNDNFGRALARKL